MTSIEDLPLPEQARIKQELLAKLAEMSAAELASRQQAYGSFAEFLAQVAYEVAGVLGYAIAIPLAWVQNSLEGAAAGLNDGFNRGLREQRAHPRRRP